MFTRFFSILSLATLSALALGAQGEIKLRMNDAKGSSTSSAAIIQISEIDGSNMSISGVKEGSHLATGRYTADFNSVVTIRGDIKTLKISMADILSVEIPNNQSQLKTLHIKDTGLQSFDFSGAANLEDIDLSTPTRFVSSKGSRRFDFSPLKKLKRLVLGIRPITILDNGLRKPGSGTGQTQHIQSVKLADGGALEELYITNCGVDEINLSNLPMLKYLQCEAATFKGTLDLTRSTKLEEVWAQLAWFEEANIHNNPSLRRFYMLNGRSLKRVNFSHSPKLLAVILDDTSTVESVDVNTCAVQLLSIKGCKSLRHVNILRNRVGKFMQPLIDQLPQVTQGLAVLDATATQNEHNVLTPEQKTLAESKGWKVNSDVTSIESIAVKPSIYPTDATDHINVEVGAAAKARLYTLSGVLVREVSLEEGINKIDLSSLTRGMYITTVGGYKQRISIR